MSIRLIIPSLDRASQLDCLLRNINKNWTLQNLKIFVLFKASSDEYYEGYRKVKWAWRRSWNVVFIDEVDFCLQVKDLCLSGHEDVVGFFTDDCVLYRRPEITPDEVRNLFAIADMHCFSLRHGLNTCVQNYLTGEIQQPLYNYNEFYKNVITWKWKTQPRFQNYGYGFSWDASWYGKDWLTKVFDICPKWENPRAAEHQFNVSDAVRNISNKYMSSCKISSVFVNTVNAVQDNCIPAGTKHNYSPKALNDRLLQDEVISLKSFDGINVNCSHGEYPLIFERSENDQR